MWDEKQLGQHFSVTPTSAFIPPGQNTKVDVIFHPRDVSSDLRVERLALRAVGAPDCHVTLTGSCTEVAP